MGPERRTFLVTGGAGYIGSHLTRDLLARGHRVRVLDYRLYGDHGLQAIADHPGLTVLDADVCDAAAVRAGVTGADSVIALAALVGDAACELHPAVTEAINCEATRILADACTAAGVRRLVFASSCSVYGAGTEHILQETSPLNPVSFYARTRVRSEEILATYHERLSVVVLRLSTVFGLSPRMRLDLLVNTFTAQACFRGWIRVFGGTQWRPNLHVRDAAAAFALAADAPDALVRGQIFNVGDDRSNHTVGEVAQLVAAALPETRVETLAAAGDPRDYRVSFAKIRSNLGFVRRHSVQDGIAEIVAACRRGDITGLSDPRSSNLESLKLFGFPVAATLRAA